MATLSEIFKKTDSLSYGPFSITKPVGAPWKEALFTVNDEIVELPHAQNIVMALLISRAGGTVQYSDLAEELDRPIASHINAPSSPMKVHIHHIKKTVREIAGQDVSDLITSRNRVGYPSGGKTKNVSGYRLLAPAL